MDNFNYVKVAAVSPIQISIGDPQANIDVIMGHLTALHKENVEIAVFPELCLTGYTCGDLFFQDSLWDSAQKALSRLVDFTKSYTNILAVIGMPIRMDMQLFNCAVAVANGRIIAVVPKSHIPNYNEFYEMRYFTPASQAKDDLVNLCGREVPFGTDILICFKTIIGKECVIGMELCEDAWVPITPGAQHCIAGAHIILNLSASNELAAKGDYRRSLISALSAQSICGYVYASASPAESTSDTVYSGHCLICENGTILKELRFMDNADAIISCIDTGRLLADRTKSTSYGDGSPAVQEHRKVYVHNWKYFLNCDGTCRRVSLTPFVPKDINKRADEILSIQAMGIAQRLKKTGMKKVVIGVSGGLDSTLALLACVRAFSIAGIDKHGIIGITMPGFGTTSGTKNNSIELMECLGITSRTIDITKACTQHLNDIEHPLDVYDVAFENAQARERTQILMDVANMENGMVIGTGDLSELALGWCTYNGDHISMYGANAGIPKTLVRHLVSFIAMQYADKSREASIGNMLANIGDEMTLSGRIAKCLQSILDTPVSPELLPPNDDGSIAQKTEESIGNYNLHDFTLYYMLRYGFSPSKILTLFLTSAKYDADWKDVKKQDVIANMKIFYSRFFKQQFKRNCVPDGVKVGSVSLSPRADWRMPSEASARIWLDEIMSMS